ncbi:c-type cytochrome [Flavihumibacter solisilvae]|jgi:nitrite reductase (NO-forming)|uniref:c-type cytochrome n=1 Tax=Flavihumibacter solisilvae TaxID=1349421 RepID=UPI00058000FD|nr:cytochrome c [Flavihumibacter solisilvae]
MKKTIILGLIGAASVMLVSFMQAGTLKESVERGKTVYESTCMSCHMTEGEGLEGAFPPLAGTGRLGDKARLVKIIYNGLSGPIKVKGKEFNMEMTPLPHLSDQEAADVLNYVRNSWGNKGAEIKPAEIAKLKK